MQGCFLSACLSTQCAPVQVLEGRGISCLELPMVETTAGPDRDKLPQVCCPAALCVLLCCSSCAVREPHLLPFSTMKKLPPALQVLAERSADFDWVCITSPEAASVFLEGWHAAGRPAVRLAVVGEGTGKVFEAAAADGAPQPQFVPSVVSAQCTLSGWAVARYLAGPAAGVLACVCLQARGSALAQGKRPCSCSSCVQMPTAASAPPMQAGLQKHTQTSPIPPNPLRQANAEHFGPELPFVEGGSKRVLYPASNKASTELQVCGSWLVLFAVCW